MYNQEKYIFYCINKELTKTQFSAREYVNEKWKAPNKQKTFKSTKNILYNGILRHIFNVYQMNNGLWTKSH